MKTKIKDDGDGFLVYGTIFLAIILTLILILFCISCERHQEVMPQKNLITYWRNLAGSFDDFNTVRLDIMARDSGSQFIAMIESNPFGLYYQDMEVEVGDKFLFKCKLKMSEGERPWVKIFDCCGTGAISDTIQLQEGINRIQLEVISPSEFNTAFLHIVTTQGIRSGFGLYEISLISINKQP